MLKTKVELRVSLDVESQDMIGKIMRLEQFISSADYRTLSEVDQSELQEQLVAMKQYIDVLIRRFCRLLDR